MSTTTSACFDPRITALPWVIIMSSVTPSVLSMPCMHHAQAVADEHQIDMIVEKPGGMGVVAGQAHHGPCVLVRGGSAEL